MFVFNCLLAQEYLADLAPLTLTKKPHFALNKPPLWMIKNGLPLVSGTANGQSGWFILDTGSPGLIINQKTESTNNLGYGLHDDLELSFTSVKAFSWMSIPQRDLSAVTVDLSHFEQSLRLPILGLIGYEQLQNFELYFNGLANHFSLSTYNLAKFSRPSSTIPFELIEHFIIVKAQIGEQELNLILDSGSKDNILDLKHASLHETEGYVLLQGLDQEQVEVRKIHLDTVIFQSHLDQELSFLATDLSSFQTNSGISIDGILGFNWINQHRLSIDYKRKLIKIWE